MNFQFLFTYQSKKAGVYYTYALWGRLFTHQIDNRFGAARLAFDALLGIFKKANP